MDKTPQRGRRYEGRVARLQIDISEELHHRIKQLALDERTTVTVLVGRFLEKAARSGRAPAPRRRTQGDGALSRLGMNIDDGLLLRVKRVSLAADLMVTRYVERVLDEAVSTAQGPRGGRG